MSGVIQTQSATQTIASGGAAVFPSSYSAWPQEGTRLVAAQYNFTSQASFTEDLSQLVSKGDAAPLQTLYVDNSGNTQGVQFVIPGAGQVINVPASSQAILPAFFNPNGPAYSITTLAAGVPTPIAATTRVIIINVPVSPCVWHI